MEQPPTLWNQKQVSYSNSNEMYSMEISRRFLLCFFILLHPLLCVFSKFVWGHLFVKHSQTCLSYFIDKKNVLQKHSGWKIYLIRGNPSFWIVSFKCTPFLTSSKRSVCYNGYSFLGVWMSGKKKCIFGKKTTEILQIFQSWRMPQFMCCSQGCLFFRLLCGNCVFQFFELEHLESREADPTLFPRCYHWIAPWLKDSYWCGTPFGEKTRCY